MYKKVFMAMVLMMVFAGTALAEDCCVVEKDNKCAMMPPLTEWGSDFAGKLCTKISDPNLGLFENSEFFSGVESCNSIDFSTISWCPEYNNNNNDNQVPEFSTVAALVALCGASLGYFFLRK